MALVEESRKDASVSEGERGEPITVTVTDKSCAVRCTTQVKRDQTVTFRLDNRSKALKRVVVMVVNDRRLLQKNGDRRTTFTLTPGGATQAETFTIDPDAADGSHEYTVTAFYTGNRYEEADCAESQDQQEDLAVASTEGRSTRPIPPSMIVQE